MSVRAVHLPNILRGAAPLRGQMRNFFSRATARPGVMADAMTEFSKLRVAQIAACTRRAIPAPVPDDFSELRAFNVTECRMAWREDQKKWMSRLRASVLSIAAVQDVITFPGDEAARR